MMSMTMARPSWDAFEPAKDTLSVGLVHRPFLMLYGRLEAPVGFQG